MLDIGWSELLVIAVILIVVVGPKDLPPMLRAFGKMMTRVRKTAGEFRSQFDEALREADLDEVRQTIQDAKRFNPASSLREAINPLRQMGEEIRADLKAATAVEAPSPRPAEPDEPAQEMEPPFPVELPAVEPLGVEEAVRSAGVNGTASASSPAIAQPMPATARAVSASASAPAAAASTLSVTPPELAAKSATMPDGKPAELAPGAVAPAKTDDPKPKRARKAPGPAMPPIEREEPVPAEPVTPRRRTAAAKTKLGPETGAGSDDAKPRRARKTTTIKKDTA